MASQFSGAANILERTTNLVDANSDYTWFGWARFVTQPTTTDYGTVYETTDGAGGYVGIYTDPADVDKFYLEVSDGMTFSDTAKRAFTINNYLPFAYVRSGNDHKLYIDNVLIGTTTLDISALVFTKTHIGTGTTTANQDTFDFREWDAALTLDELIAESKSTTPVRTADLWSNCTLLTNGNDSSGNGYNLSTVGSVSFIGSPVQRNLTLNTATAISIFPFASSYNPNDTANAGSFALWYAVSVPTGRYSLGAWAYDFSSAYGPSPFAFDQAENDIFSPLAAGDKPTQFSVTPAEITYIKIATNGTAAVAANLSILLGPQSATANGNIFVNDDSSGFPASIVSHLTDYSVVRLIPGIAAGEQGDILNNGVQLLEELPHDAITHYFIKLYTSDFVLITEIDSDDGTAIRTCLGTQRFWWAKNPTTTDPIKVRYVTSTGSLGPEHSITGATTVNCIAASNDEAVLYYNFSTAHGVKRWDLVNDIALSDLCANAPGYRIPDILVLSDNTIIVLRSATASPTVPYVERFAADGTLLNTYTFPGIVLSDNFSPARLAYALDDPDSFWVYIHESDGSGGRTAVFANVTVADGSVVYRRHAEYNLGVYQPTATISPTSRFGVSNSCPFYLLQAQAENFSGIGIVTPGRRRDINAKMPTPFFKTYYGGT